MCVCVCASLVTGLIHLAPSNVHTHTRSTHRVIEINLLLFSSFSLGCFCCCSAGDVGGGIEGGRKTGKCCYYYLALLSRRKSNLGRALSQWNGLSATEDEMETERRRRQQQRQFLLLLLPPPPPGAAAQLRAKRKKKRGKRRECSENRASEREKSLTSSFCCCLSIEKTKTKKGRRHSRQRLPMDAEEEKRGKF